MPLRSNKFNKKFSWSSVIVLFLRPLFPGNVILISNFCANPLTTSFLFLWTEREVFVSFFWYFGSMPALSKMRSVSLRASSIFSQMKLVFFSLQIFQTFTSQFLSFFLCQLFLRFFVFFWYLLTVIGICFFLYFCGLYFLRFAYSKWNKIDLVLSNFSEY